MLPIVDKPAIQYIVEEAIASGIEDIIIVTGRNKRSIEDHFDVHFELEKHLREKNKTDMLEMVQRISGMLDIYYVRQKHALGLGHAIWCARKFVGKEPFAVLLGDIIIDHPIPCLKQLMDAYEQQQAPIIAVQQVEWSKASQYGIVEGQTVRHPLYAVKKLTEKPSKPQSNLAIMGRYILEPDIFPVLELTEQGTGGEIQLTDALQQLSAKQRMFAFAFEGKLYDVGNKFGFLQATLELACKNEALAQEMNTYLNTFCPTCSVEDQEN